MFETSTQARFWTFTPQSLAEKRQASQQAAAQKLLEAEKGSRSNEQKCTALSADDEALLRRYWEHKLQAIAKAEHAQDPTRFTFRVTAAAQMYFKRFFLERSLMEEDPKNLMLTALYLAGKVEEERIDADDLLPKYAPKLETEALHALELRLLEARPY